MALDGINPLSSSARPLGDDQREPQEPLLPVLTKNQKHKLRQKRCRLAKRLRMQVRDEREKFDEKNVKKTSPLPNECLLSFVAFTPRLSPLASAALSTVATVNFPELDSDIFYLIFTK